MNVPVLLRRLPPLRDRPAEPGDPLNEKTRDGIHDGTRTAYDVEAIDKLLVPAFRTADAQALVAQNRWARREVGLLILMGLLVVASSIQAASEPGNPWPSVLVATLGALSSVLAGTTKSTDARAAYLRTRREAERLRSLAWTHLAQPEPQDPAARARTLQREVAVIRLQTVEGSGDAQAGTSDENAPSVTPRAYPARSEPSSEHLLELYLAGRLDNQRGWYRRRQAEFDAAERQGGKVRTVLLIIAGVLGALSAPEFAEDYRRWIGVAATTATALSGITTGWMRLQAFDMRARLYELTAARLDVAEADRPPTVDPPLAAAYVDQCEDIMLAEHGAWTTQTPRGAREPSPGPHATE